MIAQLYTDLAVLSPPHWSPRQRAEWITDAADATTTTELTTLLDDYLDRDADHPPVTVYGSTLHTDDRHDAVTAMLAALTIDHLTGWITSGLADFSWPGLPLEGEIERWLIRYRSRNTPANGGSA